MKKRFVYAGIGVCVIFGFVVLKQEMTRSTEQVVIQGKERITTGVGQTMSSKYVFFTDKGTFENTDSLYNLKFNSSDIYGMIKEGDVCEFTTVGWRVQFLSWYKNVIEAKCTR